MSGEMPLRAILPAYSASLWHQYAPQRPSTFDLENLLRNHQTHHTGEKVYQPIYHFGLRAEMLSYEFFGKFVPPSSALLVRRDFDYVSGLNLRESEVGALMLAGTFGAENISWNKKDDCIEVKAKEGFSLTLRGTNLVEAAVFLPRIYRSILRRLSLGEIKEGVASVNAQVEGQTEDLALVASPVKISLRLLNPNNVCADDLDRLVEESTDRALANKFYLHPY